MIRKHTVFQLIAFTAFLLSTSFAANSTQLVTKTGTLYGTLVESLRLYKVKKVILKPFMIVAGEHALNDMAGVKEDSWKSMLEKNGFEVIPVTRGLGESDDFAKIFAGHAADAAKDAGIAL